MAALRELPGIDTSSERRRWLLAWLDSGWGNADVLKVLLVDDNAIQRFIRRRVLESANFRVFEAEGSADALPIVSEHPDVLVIADHGLVGETGVDVVRKLRRIAPNLRIYILSGSVDLADEYAGLDVTLLVKGMPPGELIALAKGVSA